MISKSTKKPKGMPSGTRPRAILILGAAVALTAAGSSGAQAGAIQAPRAAVLERTVHAPQAVVLAAGSRRHPRGIGLSYDQIMVRLADKFTMDDSSPVHGQPRSLGQSANGLALLEIIGDPADISQATLIAATPSDRKEQTYENLALMIQFLRNGSPGWSGSTTWLVHALHDIARKPGSKRSIIHAGTRYTLSNSEPVGITLTIGSLGAS